MGKKYLDNFWDFRGENTKEYTHCFHTYPAMMIPQVARELINKYKNKNTKLIFDPYMGSGTTLIEAKLAGINSVGTDLNPLARLIAKVKTEKLNTEEIDEIEEKILYFKKNIFEKEFNINKINISIPEFNIRDNWFNLVTLKELGLIKNFIENIENLKIKNFFLIAFTEIIRLVSYTRNGEFKLYSIESEKKESFKPDTFKFFLEKLNENYNGLKKYNSKISNTVNTKIYDFNTIFNIPNNILKNESVDLIVTSPPYGDSKTTVAYGQFSRLANEWLEFNNPKKLDSMLMGGKKAKESFRFGFQLLDNILDKIRQNDRNTGKTRELEVVSFYKDYKSSINNISKVVKKNVIERTLNFLTNGKFTNEISENIRKKYVNIEKDFETVDIELENFAGTLLNLQEIIEQTLENNKIQIYELERYIKIGQLILERMKEEIKEKNNKEIDSEKFKQNKEMFEKKLHGLQVEAAAISQQASLTLLSIRKQNTEIALSLKNSHLLVIPVLKNAISNAIFIKQQYKITNTIEALNKATNEAMRMNVENTIEIGKKVAEINSKGGIDIKIINENQKKLLKGSEEIKKIYEKASLERLKDRNLLEQNSEELKKYISNNKKQNQKQVKFEKVSKLIPIVKCNISDSLSDGVGEEFLGENEVTYYKDKKEI